MAQALETMRNQGWQQHTSEKVSQSPKQGTDTGTGQLPGSPFSAGCGDFIFQGTRPHPLLLKEPY